MFDGKQLGETIVAQVKGFMEREIAPLRAENIALIERITALEARPAPEKGDKGEPGQDGVTPDAEDIAAAFVPAAQELVAAEVAKAVAELPPPERGEKGEDGADGKDGQDAVAPSPEELVQTFSAVIEGMVDTEVARAISLLPPPAQGEKGEKGDRGDPGSKGDAGSDGKDGRGIKDLLIDREGNLVATMGDGELKVLGPVIGKDGEKGQDGRDGFGFDDLEVNVLGDDRTIELAFRRGDEEKAFTLKWPTMIYRNVFKEGEQYQPGDMVTWAGSIWHCDKATEAKPGTEDWTLAVKKGRDGKDTKTVVRE